jgi:hypothetical protein
MSDGFGVGDLAGVADAIVGGVSGLGGSAAPDLPDAGASSGPAAAALGALNTAIGGILRAAEQARTNLSDNQQSYQDTDSGWRTAFATETDEGER